MAGRFANVHVRTAVLLSTYSRSTFPTSTNDMHMRHGAGAEQELWSRPDGGRGEGHFSWDYWLERSILMTGWVQCRSEVRYRQTSRINTPPIVYSCQNVKKVTFSSLEAVLRCVHRRIIARPQPHGGRRGFWCDNAAINPRWVSLLPLAQVARLGIKCREGCCLPWV